MCQHHVYQVRNDNTQKKIRKVKLTKPTTNIFFFKYIYVYYLWPPFLPCSSNRIYHIRGGITASNLLDKPWSQPGVFPSPLPRTCDSGLIIPAARRFSSNFANILAYLGTWDKQQAVPYWSPRNSTCSIVRFTNRGALSALSHKSFQIKYRIYFTL